MEENEQVYFDLRKHLDDSPVSFPETKSGSEIRLLKRFFTPEQAKIAIEISNYKPESLNKIHRYMKKADVVMTIDELRDKLDEMVQKGILLVCYEGYDEKHYKNAGFTAGGVIDLQASRMTKPMVDDFHAYMDEQFAAVEAGEETGISQLRTVPVDKALPLPDQFPVGSYDSVRNLIKKSPGPLAIATCT